MRIDLKCGEYLDFYNIKSIEILEHNIVKITGSVEKRKKSIKYQIYLRTIKNIKEFNRFLKKEMKEYHVDGICESCGSFNIIEVGTVMYNIKLNEPKQKYKYNSYALGGYHCKSCNKISHELEPADVVIYYKW